MHSVNTNLVKQVGSGSLQGRDLRVKQVYKQSDVYTVIVKGIRIQLDRRHERYREQEMSAK